MAAANPHNESSLIATLRARGISSNDIDDDALMVVIGDSLHEYLFFRPKVCITAYAASITTVADQPDYAKPTGALWIKAVAWNPSLLSSDYDDVWTELMLKHVEDADTGIMTFDYRQMALLHRYFQGFWTIRNDRIWLLPTPDQVYHVPVIYAGSRTIDELDQIGDYRFTDLVFYKALLAVGTKKLTGGGWRAGQLSVSESVGRETMREATKGLAEVKLQIANAYRGSRS